MNRYLLPLLLYITLVVGTIFLTWIAFPGEFSSFRGTLGMIGAAMVGVATLIGGLIPLFGVFRKSSFGKKLAGETISNIPGATGEPLMADIRTEIEELVAKNQLEKAVEKLSGFTGLQVDAGLLHQRLSSLKKEETWGTRPREELSVERTRIAKPILT